MMKATRIAVVVFVAALIANLLIMSNATVSAQQTAPLYRSCTADRNATPTPAAPAAAATAAATRAATAAAPATTAAAAPSGAANIQIFNIVAAESEVCYGVGEVFEGRGYVYAVGVTKVLDGEIGIDLNNPSASLIGDIQVNVSQFTSDQARRDGIIRERWLESNKFPTTKLTNAKVIGLPTTPYKMGETLKFKVEGDLEIRGKAVKTTFDATATLKDGTLVVTAVSDIKMSTYGVEAPNLANFVRVNDDMRIYLNLVARQKK